MSDNWKNPINGNWNTAADWSTNSVPGGSDDVVIDATGNIYSVDSTQNNAAGTLTIGGDATLIIDDNTSFTINGNISNAGTITLNNQGGNNTYLVINGAVTVSGGGIISLSDNPQNHIQGNGGSDLLTNVGNTIEGAGFIGGNGLVLANEA